MPNKFKLTIAGTTEPVSMVMDVNPDQQPKVNSLSFEVIGSPEWIEALKPVAPEIIDRLVQAFEFDERNGALLSSEIASVAHATRHGRNFCFNGKILRVTQTT